MHGLAKFAMRGRSQAVMATTVLAMLALLAPVLSVLSSAVVALVTLRKGWLDGLIVGASATLASGLLAVLVLGTPVPVAGFLLLLWLPVWLLGMFLRSSRSFDLAAIASLGFGLLLILLLYVQMGEPQARWVELLQPVAESFVESQLMDEVQSLAFVEQMSAWMTGIFAAGFAFQQVLALMLARYWQASLYNPGGFRREFHEFRTGKVIGLLALPLLGLTLLQGLDAPTFVRDLALLTAPLFFLQGLAVAHAVVARSGMKTGWLIALYAILFIALPHAGILLALIGLADVVADFRSRWKPEPDPENQ